MSPGASNPVRLRGVSKRYGSTVAVADLDLDVERAQVLALLGPNGAGKTTTVEMCEGFTRPDAGSIPDEAECVLVQMPAKETAERTLEELRARQPQIRPLPSLCVGNTCVPDAAVSALRAELSHRPVRV